MILCVCVCIYIYIFIYLIHGIETATPGFHRVFFTKQQSEHSPYYIALGSTQTHKVI